MRYQPGTIIEVTIYRTNPEGVPTLVIINDGFKPNLVRPPKGYVTQEQLNEYYLTKNYLEV